MFDQTSYRAILTLMILYVEIESNLLNEYNRSENKKYVKKTKHAEGAIRLTNGQNSAEGNVEIFHKGHWGSVCDDEFGEQEALVVCRQLRYHNFIRFTHSSYFGPARKKFWMDDLYCSGKEYELSLCKFGGWGNHDCTSNEAAGVVCQQSVHTSMNWTSTLSSTKRRIQEVVQDQLFIRLTGGRVREEGLIEIKIGYSDWGSICGDGWSLKEANVVCRQLGLGYASYASHGSFYSKNSRNVLLADVECRGTESSLLHCFHGTKTSETCSKSRENGAGVICTNDMADLMVDYIEIERSAYLQDRSLLSLQCAMEENCLASSAYITRKNRYDWQMQMRRLLRFTASVLNIGTADFRPAIPKNQWKFHQCHMHFHSMEVFARFDVLDGFGRRVAEGHKASFCLEDNHCLRGVGPGYMCANYGDQGISVNCSDIYRHNIDCQWVDITDLNPGQYTFRVSVNPEFKVGEKSFENNAAECTLYYGKSSARVYNCRLTRP